MGIFNQVAMRRPRKNKFNLSHEKKLSLKMGDLIPTYVQEVVPGDNFRVSNNILCRFAPMYAPLMHNIDVWTHYFFVPNRLVWDNWETFITGGPNGTDNPEHPYIELDADLHSNGKIEVGGLLDYMGIPVHKITSPPATPDAWKINALPIRAYHRIWYEFFRDANLDQTGFTVDRFTGDGRNSFTEQNNLCILRKRCWEKDYFTSALPWQQRGPVAGIPIEYRDIAKVTTTQNGTTGQTGLKTSQSADPDRPNGTIGNLLTDNDHFAGIQNLDESVFTINNLRRSARLQEWLEKNARGGGRYVEQLLSHFGVISPDARLQRPEFLGGGKQPVQMSEVLNTAGVLDADTLTGNPEGYMAGHGISAGQNAGFKRKFTEHGYIIGITSVLPRTSYMDGLPREYSKRFDRFDYYWPEFAQIGEQEVLNSEVFMDDSKMNDDTIFGYQSRYAEYKSACSTVHGQFKTTLDFWHMARKFDSAPLLNNTFVNSDPTKRIFPVTDADTEDLYMQVYNQVSAIRPMPYLNIPTL